MKAIVASAWLAVLLASAASLPASSDAAGGAASVAANEPALPPSRMSEGCAGAEDIAIYQANATWLPSGVPAYKVDVINQCGAGGDQQQQQACAIAGIHLRCGFFSSVNLVDPRKFRRLRHDDCLVNDGRPLLGGETVSFEYANSFPYQLSVSAATCVRRRSVGGALMHGSVSMQHTNTTHHNTTKPGRPQYVPRVS